MGLFKYKSVYAQGECSSKISREMAELLCDLGYDKLKRIDYNDEQRCKKAFDIDGFGSGVFNDGYRGKPAHDYGLSRYHYSAVDFARVDGLPCHWWCDVDHVRSERAKVKMEVEKAERIEGLDAPAAIKARLSEMLKAGKVPGPSAPDKADLSGLKPLRHYAPEGGCGAKLKLKSAVYAGCVQNAYSDDSVYLIPVDGEIGDQGACSRNLSRWCEAIRSHNGFAGSGSSYSAELVVSDLGAYVELRCRASISD